MLISAIVDSAVSARVVDDQRGELPFDGTGVRVLAAGELVITSGCSGAAGWLPGSVAIVPVAGVCNNWVSVVSVLDSVWVMPSGSGVLVLMTELSVEVLSGSYQLPSMLEVLVCWSMVTTGAAKPSSVTGTMPGQSSVSVGALACLKAHERTNWGPNVRFFPRIQVCGPSHESISLWDPSPES